MIPANKVKAGSVVIIDGELCKVLKRHHHTPGNLRAMVQAVLRNIKTGNSFPLRWAADEKIEVAFLDEREMEYLYDDGTSYNLMDTTNFEQITVDHDFFGEAIQYVLPNTKVKITFHEGVPVGVNLPQTVDLEITDCDAAIKNQTATTSYKRATMETGLTVMVPPFITRGEKIRVNTETGEYVERVGK